MVEILDLSRIQSFIQEPWKYAAAPFRIVGNLYFIGNKWVSCFLLDTGEGLLLIDSGYPETMYLIFDSIRRLGFEPHNIKFLLLSHGHWDHCGGARIFQEYCNCKTYLGADDMFLLTERRDLLCIGRGNIPEFRVDEVYDYGKSLTFGQYTIQPIHTPGHTPGTTSFIFDVENNGETLTCAMHGGLGLNGLTKAELAANRLPESLQLGFYESLKRLANQKVDVVLPSHRNVTGPTFDITKLAKEDDGSGRIFINRTLWKQMIEERIAAIKKFL
jgi:metallo-beta-lactamase class B